MRVLYSPPMVASLIPGDTFETATRFLLTRGSFSQEVPVDAILPSLEANRAMLQPEDVKRELIMRAWQQGISTAEGDQPISLTSPSFKQFVNTGGTIGANNNPIFSGLGRVYIGRIDQTETGWDITYGDNLLTFPFSTQILEAEFYSPNAEDPIAPFVPLLVGYLKSRDASAVAGSPLVPGGPNVTIGTATRLYPVFFVKIGQYSLPYFGN